MNAPENNELQSSPFRGRRGCEAIILAGGQGTRLRSVVSDVPKCMASVNGIPFINFIITYLKREGIEHFILSLGYQSEIVIEYINKTFAGLDIDYVIEDSPLGTGGAVRLACSKAKSSNVLILNGDTMFNINLNNLFEFHTENKADLTVALKEMRNFNRYGTVEIDKNSAIKSFHEKTYCEQGFINGGVYVLNVSSFMNESLPDVFSFEKDFLEKKTEKIRMYGLPCEYYFIDIGLPEDYDRFKKDYNLILDKSKYAKNDSGNFIEELFFEGLSAILTD